VPCILEPPHLRLFRLLFLLRLLFLPPVICIGCCCCCCISDGAGAGAGGKGAGAGGKGAGAGGKGAKELLDVDVPDHQFLVLRVNPCHPFCNPSNQPPP
jgi:hypothetical protein